MITASLVLYHNSPQEVAKLLECILKSSVNKLYIIDNSRDDSFRILEKHSERIRYIHNENIGYGGAHNIAIREAMSFGAIYHVVINPDIYFDEGTIEALAKYMDNNADVGWVMPKVIYPDGKLQYLCKPLPTPTDLIFRRFIPKEWFKKRKADYELRNFDYNHELNIPFLSGCFMFLRVSALQKIGIFDERFFMYGEDIDLSRRMHSEYKTIFYPKVSVVHAHKAESYKNYKMLFIHIKNIVKYFNKWGWIFDSERTKINQSLKNDLSKF